METPLILVAEDERDIRELIVITLQTHGLTEVIQAPNGQEAVAMAKARVPAIILMDVRMPKMTGYEACEALKDDPSTSNIPIIFLSAKGEKEDIHLGRLRGADDYVPKPFDFQDLLVAIQASLSRHQELYAIQEARLDGLKERILHTVNHEFRTPLSFIVTYADLMASSPTFKHSAELRQYIDGINLGSNRLLRLIEKFLTLAELESGFGERIYLHRLKTISDLESLVRETVEEVQMLANEHNLTVTLEVEPDLPSFVGDPDYLQIAIFELVENAVKFTPKEKPGPVTIALKQGAHGISVQVSDKGMGIEPERQEELFDLFHQLDRSKWEIGGIGSGLTIVQHIARLHGGQIRLESEPGVGSRFELRLPLSQDGHEAAAS